MEHVWDGSVDAFSNSIRVHISALRKKLKAELNYDPITNKVGEGYRIGESGNEATFFTMETDADDGGADCRYLYFFLNLALSRAGMFYMDKLGQAIFHQTPTADFMISIPGADVEQLPPDFEIQINDTKKSFTLSSWLITLLITLVSGCITYFVSGYALRTAQKLFRQNYANPSRKLNAISIGGAADSRISGAQPFL